MVQSRSHPAPPATTNQDSSQRTMDQQTLHEFRAPQLLLAITLSRTIHLQDRRPPSVPNAGAGTHPSCPACETRVRLFQAATRLPSQADRLMAASLKAGARAHGLSAKSSRQTRDNSSHPSRKTFRSLLQSIRRRCCKWKLSARNLTTRALGLWV